MLLSRTACSAAYCLDTRIKQPTASHTHSQSVHVPVCQTKTNEAKRNMYHTTASYDCDPTHPTSSKAARMFQISFCCAAYAASFSCFSLDVATGPCGLAALPSPASLRAASSKTPKSLRSPWTPQEEEAEQCLVRARDRYLSWCRKWALWSTAWACTHGPSRKMTVYISACGTHSHERQTTDGMSSLTF